MERLELVLGAPLAVLGGITFGTAVIESSQDYASGRNDGLNFCMLNAGLLMAGLGTIAIREGIRMGYARDREEEKRNNPTEFYGVFLDEARVMLQRLPRKDQRFHPYSWRRTCQPRYGDKIRNR